MPQRYLAQHIGSRNWGDRKSRRAFLKTPETFQARFEYHNFLRILKTKNFPGMKFGNMIKK